MSERRWWLLVEFISTTSSTTGIHRRQFELSQKGLDPVSHDLLKISKLITVNIALIAGSMHRLLDKHCR